MEDGDERPEMCEHIVEVDEYTEIRLKIPKTIDSVSFFALLQKASRLLKMSEIVPTGTRKYVKHQSDVITPGRSRWTEELKDDLLRDYEVATKEEKRTLLISKYGFEKVNSLQQKVCDIKKERGLSPRSVNGMKKDGKYNKWTEEMKSNLIRDYENATTEERLKLPKKYGIGSLGSLQSRIWEIRNIRGVKKIRGINKKYSDDVVNQLVKHIKNDVLTMREIAEKHNMDKKKVYNLIRNRTGKTISELRGR